MANEPSGPNGGHDPPDVDEAVLDEAHELLWKPSLHQVLIMVTLSAISFMVSLDATIAVTSLNAVVTDLNGTTTQGFWIGTSYVLCTAVTMSFLAAISDIFGRPICLMFSLLAFTVGTIIGAAAPNIGTLLVGRALQGIGGGGIIVISLITFTDIVPLRFRPKWYGTVLGAWAMGSLCGPVTGGAIAEHTTWRWIFYVLLPFCAVGFVAIPTLLTIKPKTATMAEKMGRVDWVGGFLFISSATLFLIAISWGGTQFPWASAQTLAPLILGVVGLGATFAWEHWFAKEPFLKRRLFWSIGSVAAYICGVIQGLLLFGNWYYVPFNILAIKGFTATQTGAALLPVNFTLIPAAVVTGVLVSRYNNYRLFIWIGWVLIIIGGGLTVYWAKDFSAPVWVITLLLFGFGHGFVLNAQNFATQAMCKPGDEASAAAMYGFARQFGGAIGIGIGGTIFQNVMGLKLSWEGLPPAIASNAEAFIAVLRTMPPGPEKTKILDAYTFGFQGVYASFVGVSGLALFLSLLIHHSDMNKKLESEHTLQATGIRQLDEHVLQRGISRHMAGVEVDGARNAAEVHVAEPSSVEKESVGQATE